MLNVSAQDVSKSKSDSFRVDNAPFRRCGGDLKILNSIVAMRAQFQ